MTRALIISTNCALLIFLLIGFPAATRADFGSLQISSAHTARLLTFCGLGIATAGNILAALFLIKGRKEKILCWEWAAVFGALLLANWAFVRGWIRFGWLQKSMLWLQKNL